MEHIATSSDVGTSKVCTIVVEMKDEDINRALGIGIVPSYGIHKALVTNISEPATAIREPVREAEHSSGIEVKSAYVGITGSHIQSFNSQVTSEATSTDSVLKRFFSQLGKLWFTMPRNLLTRREGGAQASQLVRGNHPKWQLIPIGIGAWRIK
jgi:hypothetical protein